jgi:hypothetical protein
VPVVFSSDPLNDHPVICGVEIAHVAHRPPSAEIVAAMPGTINFNRRGMRLHREQRQTESNYHWKQNLICISASQTQIAGLPIYRFQEGYVSTTNDFVG